MIHLLSQSIVFKVFSKYDQCSDKDRPRQIRCSGTVAGRCAPTGNHGLCLRTVESWINKSRKTQDLFLSNVSSSEPSESTQDSHASTDIHIEEGQFLVLEDQLKQLLLHCLKCGSNIQEVMRELQNEGSQF